MCLLKRMHLQMLLTLQPTWHISGCVYNLRRQKHKTEFFFYQSLSVVINSSHLASLGLFVIIFQGRPSVTLSAFALLMFREQ